MAHFWHLRPAYVRILSFYNKLCYQYSYEIFRVTDLPWDYAIDIYAAGLVMYEMILGSPIIRPGYNAAETLTQLLAFFGPLPDHLAKHARRATDLPFKDANMTPFLALSFLKRPEMDLQKMGVSKSSLMATRVTYKTVEYQLCKETGGLELVRLIRKMVDYDPKKRISAGEALKNAYFFVPLPQPIPPEMLAMNEPKWVKP